MEKGKEQELTDHDPLALVNWGDNEDEDTGTGPNRESHHKGVKAHVEQEGEATATDVMLLTSTHIW